MHNLGLEPNKPYKKSARVVGDTLGLLHPHGDSSVYGAMVHIAQDFNMRYPLIDGHGNWGSLDGDPAAAMRYTECRMSPISHMMMENIDKETVDFCPNFDDTFTEPTVLPTMFPNLLANGCTGIAVGMGTNIPPHNVADLYRSMDLILQNEIKGVDTPIEDLIGIIKAPDFPTAGEIINGSAMQDIYRTGRGRVVVRCKYQLEDKQIIVTELPFRVNKANLIEKIAALRETLPDIKKVADESDKEGIRIVIGLAKDANAEWIIRQLLKKTDLQSSFSVNMVALVNKKPQQFDLKTALEFFLAHTADVTRRQVSYDLKKATDREHLVVGFLVAIENIDKTIKIIRNSDTTENCVNALCQQLEVTMLQAKAILDMKLSSLRKLSVDELTKELAELRKKISFWTNILSSNTELLSHLRGELAAVVKKFPADRKTQLTDNKDADMDERDMVHDEQLVLSYTANGLVKLVPVSEYQTKGRRTKGVQAMPSRVEDAVRFILTLNAKDDLLFLTNIGRCYALPAFKVPVSSRTQIGKYLSNFIAMQPSEKIVGLVSRKAKQTGDLLLFTKNGMVKRISLDQLSSRLQYTQIMTFKDQDELVSVKCVSASFEPMMLTALGKGLRFDPSSVRATGRSSMGVQGMKLTEGDQIVDAVDAHGAKELLIVTDNGITKRISLEDFTVKGRRGQGVRTINNTGKDGKLNPAVGAVLSGAVVKNETDELFIATQNGQMSRFALSEIRVMGRGAVGVATIKLAEGDKIVSIAVQPMEEIDAA